MRKHKFHQHNSKYSVLILDIVLIVVILLNPVIIAGSTFVSYPGNRGAPVAPQAYRTPRSHPSFIYVGRQEHPTIDNNLCVADIIYHLECRQEREIRSANTNRHNVTSLPQISIWFHAIL